MASVIRHLPKPVKPQPGEPMARSKSPGFLDLPGETRNTIYLLIFDDHHVLIQQSHRIGNKNHGRLEQGRHASKHLTGKPLRHTNPAHPLLWRGKNCQARANILRTCHRVHDEAISLLYASTGFEFTAMNAINKFLDTVPPTGLQAITRLSLHHETYGEPGLTADREWKLRHDRKWWKMCTRIASEMTGVQELVLYLRVCDWPTQLDLQATWARPLLLLRGKNSVWVYLKCSAFPECRLQGAGRVLSNALMDSEGQVECDKAATPAAYDAKNPNAGKMSGFVKATQVLTIRPTNAQL